MLEDVKRQYAVDENRIYLVGISTGGTAGWEALLRFPNYFAAALLFGAGSGDLANASRLRSTPIWVFHSKFDPGVPIERTRTMVDSVRQAGGCIALTEVERFVHDCWQAGFQKYRAAEWLLSQQKETPCWRQPGGGLDYRLQVSIYSLLTAVGTAIAWQMRGRFTYPFVNESHNSESGPTLKRRS